MDYNKATGEWQLCYNWRSFCDPFSEANCVTRPSDRIPCTDKSYSREIELFKTSGKSLWFPKKAETSYERVSQFNAWLDEDFASATARTTYSLMRSSAHITAYWLATSRGSHPLVRSPCVGGQVLCRFRLGLNFLPSSLPYMASIVSKIEWRHPSMTLPTIKVEEISLSIHDSSLDLIAVT